MQNNTYSNRGNVGLKAGMLSSAFQAANEAGIDPATLSQLDIALFRSLRKIGHPRERICSALCLSYAEYDKLLELIE